MRFQVFENGKVANEFKLCGAYLFGADGIAIRKAKITFKDGFIECSKPNMATAGLALLWTIDGFGRILLPTTCLPERKRPYILNVEIARAKLMRIINKREDWSLFDDIEELKDISEQSQNLLTQALQNISDPPRASEFADGSLRKSIVLSEKLAAKHADMYFKVRSKNRSFGRGCLGCQIDPGRIGEPEYIKRVQELFGSVTIPINWGKIECQKGHYDFSVIENCLEILDKKRLSITAGPLLCFSKEYLPQWLLSSDVGFEKIREAGYKFILNTVERFAPVIHTWRVISGLNVFNHFGFDFEQVLEMTRAANMAVKATGDSRTLKIIEISNPWGEYYSSIPNTIPPLVYVDMVVQSGINFDAFGLQICFGKNQAGMHVKDMLQISSVLDFFGQIAKPLYITEVEVPSRHDGGEFDVNVAGVWHEKWDQRKQRQWIDQFYKIALSKPFVDTVTYANLADGKDNKIANSGLLTGNLEPKESFKTLKKFRELIFRR